jgi:hypothetical protein
MGDNGELRLIIAELFAYIIDWALTVIAINDMDWVIDLCDHTHYSCCLDTSVIQVPSMNALL